MSTCATITSSNALKLLELFLYNVFCKHFQVPGAAKELPDDRVRGAGEGVLSQAGPGTHPTTWTAASGELL